MALQLLAPSCDISELASRQGSAAVLAATGEGTSGSPLVQTVGLSVTDAANLAAIAATATTGTAYSAVSAADITGTDSTAVKAAAGAGISTYITALSIQNLAAAVATRVDILDGSTVIWSVAVGVGGGCANITFPTPLKGTANTAINAQCGTNAAQVRVAIAGYTA